MSICSACGITTCTGVISGEYGEYRKHACGFILIFFKPFNTTHLNFLVSIN